MMAVIFLGEEMMGGRIVDGSEVWERSCEMEDVGGRMGATEGWWKVAGLSELSCIERSVVGGAIGGSEMSRDMVEEVGFLKMDVTFL